MRKLLIVDDEKNIRLGLKAMIEKEFPGAYDLHFACDGIEAYDLLAQTDVEIVITDIRMPGMDGIALINQINELQRRPFVLILSGHDDFQYAKEAIRNEVKGYLLKPIVREELFRSLRRLEKDLIRKYEITEQIQNSILLQGEFKESQLNYVLLHPSLDEGEMVGILAKIGMEWMDEGFRVGLVKFMIQPASSVECLERTDALLKNVAEEHRQRMVRFVGRGNQVIIIADRMELFTGLLDQNVEPYFFSHNLGLSEHLSGMKFLKSAYEQAQQALKYTFLKSVPGVVQFEIVKDKSKDFVVPRGTIEKMSNMLGTDRGNEMTSLLLETLDIKTIGQFDIAYLEAVGKALNELVFDKVFHVYGGESIEILKLFKKVGDPYNFTHFHDYFHSVEALLQRLNEYVKTIKTSHIDHKEMKRAIQYIDENFHKDINMATVSNHVSLNYTYFSQAFKEFTGESFVQYVKKRRIEKAKVLLGTTELKIYEIGSMVGFENIKHFNRVFKEILGVTPLEYRDKNLLYDMKVQL